MMKCLVFVSKTTGFECLKWLLDSYPDDEFKIFISEPDRDLIADYLDARNIPYHDVAKADPEKVTAGQDYDWLINIWGAYIFRSDLLGRVKNSVNLHPSYLPYGRGRDPVVWAIRDGVPAGVTMHEITEGVDVGPIWAQVKIPYTFPISGQDLYRQVEKACISLFTTTWPDLRTGKLNAQPQGQPELPIRKRKDLLADQVLSMDDPATKALITKILGHDFSGNGYSALLKDGDKSYTLTLAINPTDEN
jgi:methionyl-tRNA formyltransferase